MTRDEAIKIVHQTSNGFVVSDKMASCLIDTYVGLGMLKLEESKDPFIKLDDYIKSTHQYGNHMTERVFSLVAGAGLKIVEA